MPRDLPITHGEMAAGESLNRRHVAGLEAELARLRAHIETSDHAHACAVQEMSGEMGRKDAEIDRILGKWESTIAEKEVLHAKNERLRAALQVIADHNPNCSADPRSCRTMMRNYAKRALEQRPTK